SFYKALSRCGLRHDPRRFFPFIWHYSVEGRDVNLLLQELSFPRHPEHSEKPLRGRIHRYHETEVGRRDIIVKSNQRYNAEAHRLLAASGLAPKFLYCSEEGPSPIDLAGSTMVVMEYIDGKTVHERYGNNHLRSAFSIWLRHLPHLVE
ncbi:hypothetical protein H4582DRAFT_1936667, partial [Lactarius indigo]